MRTVRAVRREAQFRGAGQLERPRSRTLIDQRDAANLRIVFRRHRHFQMTLDPQPAAAELGAIAAEGRRVAGVFHV